jgi:hypothetical protein
MLKPLPCPFCGAKPVMQMFGWRPQITCNNYNKCNVIPGITLHPMRAADFLGTTDRTQAWIELVGEWNKRPVTPTF